SLLRRQLQANPQDGAALRLLARVAVRREDYIQAERLLGECLRLAPGDAAARFDLALTFFAQQKADPLLPLIERLLVFEPHNKQYVSLQANAYSLLGHNERAIRIFSALLEQHPNDEHVWLVYGHALRLAGHRDEAIAAYRRSTQLLPAFGEAWF